MSTSFAELPPRHDAQNNIVTVTQSIVVTVTGIKAVNSLIFTRKQGYVKAETMPRTVPAHP